MKNSNHEKYHLFIDKWYDELLNIVNTIHRTGSDFTFDVPYYGTITYYPKKDKLQIWEPNEWKNDALNWIINNIINE